VQNPTTFSSVLKRTFCKLNSISVPQLKFLINIFPLWFSINGKYNFKRLGMIGWLSEKSLRHSFKWNFNWLEINCKIIEENCGQEMIAVFDPSFIPKSGKKTPGLGWYWSGVAQKMSKGLEIGCLAFIDVATRTAMHGLAIQTPAGESLQANDSNKVQHYKNIILENIDLIKGKTKYLAVDSYFMKKDFILPILNQGLHIITKMRSDANLKYLFKGNQNGKKGRNKKHDGKVIISKIDKRRMLKEAKIENAEIYSAVLYCESLKRNAKILFIYFDGKINPEILLCTDEKLEVKKIFEYYGLRFQIEFLIRDAKQHTGLTDCMARDEQKLKNHFNISLTAVSIAKTEYYSNTKTDTKLPFSMLDVKMLHHNHSLASRIFSMLEIDMSLIKNKRLFDKCLQYGRDCA
jgi:Transposase DDE domain